MARLLARFRRPKADVRIETSKEPPPDNRVGGGVFVTINLQPLEPFLLRRARLELVRNTTRFSRTALDGYHEYSSEEVWQTVQLCENATAQPSVPLACSVELHIPEDPPSKPALPG